MSDVVLYIYTESLILVVSHLRDVIHRVARVMLFCLRS